MTNAYTCRREVGRKTIWTIREDQAHLPHVMVSWYMAGCGETGVCAVLPGETNDEAATRAFNNSTFDKRRTVRLVVWAAA